MPNLRQWKSLTVELMHAENDQMLAVRSLQDDCVLTYAAYRRTLVAGAPRHRRHHRTSGRSAGLGTRAARGPYRALAAGAPNHLGDPVGKERDMDERTHANRVLQMRLVVEAPDYDQAVAFYRDVLGCREDEAIESREGARVTILDAGRATLELSNPAQVAFIDDVEVGRRVSPRLRVAFEVANAHGVTEDLVEGGAELIAGPTETPWRSLNSRLSAPAGLQITLFEELG
jgi:lactoylglutathione lyase